MRTTLELAHYYASLGYEVFPCHSVGSDGCCTCRLGSTCPYSRAAKHPRTRYGRKEASTDPTTLDLWWKKWPNSNVAIATGRKSGIFVLDMDRRNGGHFTLEHLEERYRRLIKSSFESVSATQTSITGSLGKHFMFRYPKEFSLPGGSNLLGRGLDICSDGQHIIAPPSLHMSGNRYRWHGNGITPIEAPDWLIYEILQNSIATRGTVPRATIDHVTSSTEVSVFETGSRNNMLFMHAAGLVNSFTSAEIRHRLQEMNQSLCSPPLSIDEVDKIVSSVERYR